MSPSSRRSATARESWPGSARDVVILRARRALPGVALVAVLSGCAARGFVLPTGPAVAAPDAALLWRHATAACRGAATYSAEMRVKGRMGPDGTRLRGTLQGAVTARDQIRLQLVAFGTTGFVLAGDAARATLVIPRDNRVLTAPAADIVDALTGLRLTPRELLAVLSGCVSAGAAPRDGEWFGKVLVVPVGASRVFLRRAGSAAEVIGGELGALTVAYSSHDGEFPAEVRLRSTAAASTPLDVTMILDQRSINTTLPDGTFRISVPAGAAPLTLQELRSALREKQP